MPTTYQHNRRKQVEIAISIGESIKEDPTGLFWRAVGYIDSFYAPEGATRNEVLEGLKVYLDALTLSQQREYEILKKLESFDFDKKIEIPSGLTREEKRQFIINNR